MAQPHVQSGHVVSVRALGDALAGARTTALPESPTAGSRAHRAARRGRDARTPDPRRTHRAVHRRAHEFTIPAASHVLEAGDFIHLRGEEPHALRALSDASALVTICLLPLR